MKTMKNYYDLYLKCHVLLLADVLSWVVMFNMTKVEHELV